MQGQIDVEPGPSRPRSTYHGAAPRKPRVPFVSKDNRPGRADGRYRVVLISSGSVASIKVPDIVGSLARNRNIELQVVGTAASLRFYDQAKVDDAVRRSIGNAKPGAGDDEDMRDDDLGVKVWKDEDEWSDWKQVGDPILHIELRRWADLVLVAPCSADMLAKIAGGICDNLATSLLRALSPDTPTILFPAMNTHMYSHPLTNDHLNLVQEKLNYMVSGPQGAGRLACGDEGPGKMTDWRDIVTIVEDMAVMHRAKFAEARIFRELGPGTATQGPLSLDLHQDGPSLESRGLSSLIAADQSHTKGNIEDIEANIRFSAVKDPLEYNNFQRGLSVEKTGHSHLQEPVRTAGLPGAGGGWDTRRGACPPLHPTSGNSTVKSASGIVGNTLGGWDLPKATDPLKYNGNQPGLSVERSGNDFREPVRMAGIPPILNRPGACHDSDGGWRSDLKDDVALGATDPGGITGSWDKLKRSVHTPLEVNGNQPGLSTDRPSSIGEPIRMESVPLLMSGNGPYQSSNDPTGGWRTPANETHCK